MVNNEFVITHPTQIDDKYRARLLSRTNPTSFACQSVSDVFDSDKPNNGSFT